MTRFFLIMPLTGLEVCALQYRAKVDEVMPGSIAEELGIVPGDIICKINGRRIADFLDYQFLASSPEIVLEVKKATGEVIEFDIENNV